MARMSRRAFLNRSAATALAVSGGVLLSACGDRDPTGAPPGAGGPQLASPENPVTWPVPADAGRIADGLTPEQGATLRVYNWSEYLYKKVAQDFEKKYKKYDVKVQISTYGNMDEAVAKLRGGQVAFDVLFPTYDYLGKLVQETSCAPSTTPTSRTSSRSGRPSRTPGTTRAGTTRCRTRSTPPGSPGGSTRSRTTSPRWPTRTRPSGTPGTGARSASSMTTARASA